VPSSGILLGWKCSYPISFPPGRTLHAPRGKGKVDFELVGRYPLIKEMGELIRKRINSECSFSFINKEAVVIGVEATCDNVRVTMVYLHYFTYYILCAKVSGEDWMKVEV